MQRKIFQLPGIYNASFAYKGPLIPRVTVLEKPTSTGDSDGVSNNLKAISYKKLIDSGLLDSGEIRLKESRTG